MKKNLLACLFLCFFSIFPLFAQHDVTVENSSSFEIKSFQLFDYYTYKWSDNLLNNQTMEPGNRIVITIPDCGYVDFRIIRGDGSVYYIEEIWMCDDTAEWRILSSMFSPENKE